MTTYRRLDCPCPTEHVSRTGRVVAGVGASVLGLQASGLFGLLLSAAASDEEVAFAVVSRSPQAQPVSQQRR